MRSFKPILRDPRALKPSPHNVRLHSRKQIRQLAKSINKFGFIGVAAIDENGTILAGHARVEAAIVARVDQIPCVVVDHLTEKQKRAFAIADNKHASNSTWDEQRLAIEIDAILLENPDLELDSLGFDAIELDQLRVQLEPNDLGGSPEDDALPETQADVPAVTDTGDIWICGDHRIICADSRAANSYEKILGSECAELILADPPYNVPIDGHVGGSGRIHHREFAMASGEMSRAEFIDFLQAVFERLSDFSVNGSIHFVFMDWRHMAEIMAAANGIYAELKNLIVWAKDNGGMGSFYRSRHELIFAFKNGDAPHINNFELGQKGRYRTNVWNYRGINSAGADRLQLLKLHPTVKPVQMLADAILDCSKRGGIVLDPFGGSGSTLIAAEKTKRRARLIEIDPVYVDRTIRRWQAYAKDDAIHSATGKTFELARAATGVGTPSDCHHPLPGSAEHPTGGFQQGRVAMARKAQSNLTGSDPDDDRGDNEVGYGSPPAKHRFKPGKSGNPKGRPKGSKNLKTQLQEVLGEMVDVREPNGRTRKFPIFAAAVMVNVRKAAKGDSPAFKNLIPLLDRVGLLGPPDSESDGHAKGDVRMLLDAYLQRRSDQGTLHLIGSKADGHPKEE